MSISVEVTEHDIRHGKRGDPCQCPVARAIRRAIGQPEAHVIVGVYAVEAAGCAIGEGDDAQVFVLPVRAARWVQQFDLGDPVEPIAFELEPL
jgi:hypothetical protein